MLYPTEKAYFEILWLIRHTFYWFLSVCKKDTCVCTFFEYLNMRYPSLLHVRNFLMLA